MSAAEDGNGAGFTFNGVPIDPDLYRQAARELIASKHFINASVTMLIYDHIITFEDEVERIWKPKFTGATLLFLLNRYFTPLSFIVNIASFHDPGWTTNIKSCIDFVKFPGAATLVSIAIVEIVLITRTYALYGASNYYLLAFLVSLFITQMVLMGVSMHFTHMLPIPPGLTGCILTGNSPFFAAFWTAPLVTDTIVFLLTLWKTGQYFKQNVRIPLLVVLRRDGILYFGVIFAANLMNVLIYSFAPEGIKAIGASFSQLVTNVMISRLQLNLRHPRIRTSLRIYRQPTEVITSEADADSSKSSTAPYFTLTNPNAVVAEGAASNFFTETLWSLGRPLENSYGEVECVCGNKGRRGGRRGGRETRDRDGDRERERERDGEEGGCETETASETCYCSSATVSPVSPSWKKREKEREKGWATLKVRPMIRKSSRSRSRPRSGMLEIEEVPMDELSSSSSAREGRGDRKRPRFDEEARHPPKRAHPPVVDPSSLFPSPRSTRSLSEQANEILISDALIDGLEGPILYDDWRTAKNQSQSQGNGHGQSGQGCRKGYTAV